MKPLTPAQRKMLLHAIDVETSAGVNIRALSFAADMAHHPTYEQVQRLARKGCLRANPTGDTHIYTVTHWGRYQAGVPVCRGARKPRAHIEPYDAPIEVTA